MRADDQDKSAPAPEAVRRIHDKLFLGPEFVTWLYFTLVDEGMELALPDAFPKGVVDAPDEGIVRFAMGKRAALKAHDLTGAKVLVSGPGLDDNGEILQAVRRGALMDVLSLEMAVGNRVYSFTMNAGDGGLSGVKLPDLFSDPEDAGDTLVLDGDKPKVRRPKLPFEDVLALRMSCLDELERIIDVLFARFVTRRVARAWQTEDVRGIRRQVAKGLKSRMLEDR